MRRRALLGLAGALAGCGFELRRTPEMPFTSLALTGFDAHSPLAVELRRTLGARVKILDTPDKAEVVLHARVERRERSVVASTAAAQVRELTLRLRFEFELTGAGGRELALPIELLLSRDMSYSETYALAKGQEEAELYAAMQSDIAQQVARRLARVHVPGAH